MNKKILVTALVLNLAVAVMEIFAAITSFKNHGTSMFRFYTEDVNLFAGVAAVLGCIFIVRILIKKRRTRSGPFDLAGKSYRSHFGVSYAGNDEGCLPQWVFYVKYVAVSCLAVTFVLAVADTVFMASDEAYKMMFMDVSMLLNQTLCALTALISFIIFEMGKYEIRMIETVTVMIPTMIYAAIRMIVGGTGRVAVWCVIVLAIAFAAAFLIKIASNRRWR